MPGSLTRRQFAASGLAAGLAPPASARAAEPIRLIVDHHSLEVNGKAARVLGICQPDGTAGLRIGDVQRFGVRVENRLAEPTLIHWHGLTPPYRQDGVPGLSGPPIAPGGAASYDFPLDFSGTFWMHSHVGLQEQSLLAAPLIIGEAAAGGAPEATLFLHDFSFRTPEEIFASLRGAAKPDAMAGMDMGGTTPSGHGDASMPGMAMPGMAMPGMAMPDGKMDLNDVVYDAFLANDRTLADPYIVRVAPGEQLRLRVINAASASNFHIDLGALDGTLIAVDGHEVAPLRGGRFPVTMAQRLDLLLDLPASQGAWPVLAILEGGRQRTGLILATQRGAVRKLAPVAAEAAPPLDLTLERRLAAAAPLPPRQAGRVLRVDLTGSMAGFVWGMNGVAYGHDAPLMVRAGERVEIVMTNRTAMSHPMHLHGHVFQVVAIGADRFAGARRDTVLVPKGQSVTIAFDADNPGIWAFHCHNLYHMQAGMMTSLRYG